MEIKDIPEFVNREKEIRQIKALLSGRPNLVYFVYGPINSGKTALLIKVFEKLPDDYRVFYINFRWRYVADINDLLQVLFEVKVGEYKEGVKDIVKEILKEGSRTIKRFKEIPIPERIFDIIFSEKKIENIFKYLETVFEEIRAEKKIPVFVLDEMQTIKELINTSGKSVIHELFNFMVGLTKETHLCHCLCATSDCLFIEDIYSNARLEGRAEYVLIDDLNRDEAFEVYGKFGFENKELIWDYIGGKIGDMIRLYEKKKRGLNEVEAVEELLTDTIGKLKWLFRLIREGEKGNITLKEVKEALKLFKEKNFINEEEIKGRVLRFLIEENLLFYNPVNSTVRPQGKLIQKAIKKILS